MITINVTEDDLMTALRGFLLSAFQCEVFQGQGNRAATPKGMSIEMTTMRMRDLSTNKTKYDDTGDPATATIKNSRSSEWAVQLDFYGETSMAMASTVAGLVRTPYAVEMLAATGIDLAPLYANDPIQTTMVNGEQQYEPRWTVELVNQFNPVLSTPMQYIALTSLDLVSVDVEFPPED